MHCTIQFVSLLRLFNPVYTEILDSCTTGMSMLVILIFKCLVYPKNVQHIVVKMNVKMFIEVTVFMMYSELYVYASGSFV